MVMIIGMIVTKVEFLGVTTWVVLTGTDENKLLLILEIYCKYPEPNLID